MEVIQAVTNLVPLLLCHQSSGNNVLGWDGHIMVCCFSCGCDDVVFQSASPLPVFKLSFKGSLYAHQTERAEGLHAIFMNPKQDLRKFKRESMQLFIWSRCPWPRATPVILLHAIRKCVAAMFPLACIIVRPQGCLCAACKRVMPILLAYYVLMY